MVMERRHRKNAFAGEFETQNLENNRDRFDYENAADNDEKQFLFAADCHHADQSADRERAGIAHENFGGVTIKPEKSETGADERGTDNAQLAGKWIERDL